MIRRIARELVLQSLFQIDFAQVDCEAALNAAVEERSDKSAEKAKEYAQDVLNGVLANSEAIDARISEYAIDWTLERMPAVDRNILRVAVYEMFFAAEKLVPNVAINEAVEMATKIGAKRTYFIHFSHDAGKHADVALRLPPNMYLSYDNLQIEF